MPTAYIAYDNASGKCWSLPAQNAELVDRSIMALSQVPSYQKRLTDLGLDPSQIRPNLSAMGGFEVVSKDGQVVTFLDEDQKAIYHGIFQAAFGLPEAPRPQTPQLERPRDGSPSLLDEMKAYGEELDRAHNPHPPARRPHGGLAEDIRELGDHVETRDGKSPRRADTPRDHRDPLTPEMERMQQQIADLRRRLASRAGADTLDPEANGRLEALENGQRRLEELIRGLGSGPKRVPSHERALPRRDIREGLLGEFDELEEDLSAEERDPAILAIQRQLDEQRRLLDHLLRATGDHGRDLRPPATRGERRVHFASSPSSRRDRRASSPPDPRSRSALSAHGTGPRSLAEDMADFGRELDEGGDQDFFLDSYRDPYTAKAIEDVPLRGGPPLHARRLQASTRRVRELEAELARAQDGAVDLEEDLRLGFASQVRAQRARHEEEIHHLEQELSQAIAQRERELRAALEREQRVEEDRLSAENERLTAQIALQRQQYEQQMRRALTVGRRTVAHVREEALQRNQALEAEISKMGRAARRTAVQIQQLQREIEARGRELAEQRDNHATALEGAERRYNRAERGLQAQIAELTHARDAALERAAVMERDFEARSTLLIREIESLRAALSSEREISAQVGQLQSEVFDLAHIIQSDASVAETSSARIRALEEQVARLSSENRLYAQELTAVRRALAAAGEHAESAASGAEDTQRQLSGDLERARQALADLQRQSKHAADEAERQTESRIEALTRAHEQRESTVAGEAREERNRAEALESELAAAREENDSLRSHHEMRTRQMQKEFEAEVRRVSEEAEARYRALNEQKAVQERELASYRKALDEERLVVGRLKMDLSASRKAIERERARADLYQASGQSEMALRRGRETLLDQLSIRDATIQELRARLSSLSAQEGHAIASLREARDQAVEEAAALQRTLSQAKAQMARLRPEKGEGSGDEEEVELATAIEDAVQHSSRTSFQLEEARARIAALEEELRRATTAFAEEREALGARLEQATRIAEAAELQAREFEEALTQERVISSALREGMGEAERGFSLRERELDEQRQAAETASARLSLELGEMTRKAEASESSNAVLQEQVALLTGQLEQAAQRERALSEELEALKVTNRSLLAQLEAASQQSAAAAQSLTEELQAARGEIRAGAHTITALEHRVEEAERASAQKGDALSSARVQAHETQGALVRELEAAREQARADAHTIATLGHRAEEAEAASAQKGDALSSARVQAHETQGALEQELEKARKATSRKESQLLKATGRAQAAEEREKEATARVDVLQRELEAARFETGQTREVVAQLAREKAALEQSNASLLQRATRAEERIVVLERELALLRSQLQDQALATQRGGKELLAERDLLAQAREEIGRLERRLEAQAASTVLEREATIGGAQAEVAAEKERSRKALSVVREEVLLLTAQFQHAESRARTAGEQQHQAEERAAAAVQLSIAAQGEMKVQMAETARVLGQQHHEAEDATRRELEAKIRELEQKNSAILRSMTEALAFVRESEAGLAERDAHIEALRRENDALREEINRLVVIIRQLEDKLRPPPVVVATAASAGGSRPSNIRPEVREFAGRAAAAARGGGGAVARVAHIDLDRETQYKPFMQNLALLDVEILSIDVRGGRTAMVVQFNTKAPPGFRINTPYKINGFTVSARASHDTFSRHNAEFEGQLRLPRSESARRDQVEAVLPTYQLLQQLLGTVAESTRQSKTFFRNWERQTFVRLLAFIDDFAAAGHHRADDQMHFLTKQIELNAHIKDLKAFLELVRGVLRSRDLSTDRVRQADREVRNEREQLQYLRDNAQEIYDSLQLWINSYNNVRARR